MGPDACPQAPYGAAVSQMAGGCLGAARRVFFFFFGGFCWWGCPEGFLLVGFVGGNSTGGARGYTATWNKPDRERQITSVGLRVIEKGD